MTSERSLTFAIFFGAIAITPAPAPAATVTACTTTQICYCVNQDLTEAIDKRVAEIRQRIADQRARGKAVGYLSIPISSLGGGYEGVNTHVAARVAEQLMERFGASAVWILNTAAPEVKLPPTARGAEYMLMWTRVLEGDDGLGRDFEFIYFVGPADFARVFKLTGKGDMEALEAWYDANAKTDPELAKIDRGQFRNYYSLRASATASRGSHDEWNVVRIINERRRHDRHKGEFGIGRQIAMLFDGHAQAPGPTEAATHPGYAGGCP